jgi:hypothetical protein
MSKTKVEDSNEAQAFSIWSIDGKMLFENIIKATESFDDNFYFETVKKKRYNQDRL